MSAAPPISPMTSVYPASFYRAPENFKSFTDTIENFLKANQFVELDHYFNIHSTKFRFNLEDNGTLDLLLESYLTTEVISGEDFERAKHLAALMENNLYSTTWVKIATAMLYYAQGDITTGDTLVEQMVERDQNLNFSLHTRSELLRLFNDYDLVENPLMQGRIKRILKTYNEITIAQPPPVQTVTYELWIKGRV